MNAAGIEKLLCRDGSLSWANPAVRERVTVQSEPTIVASGSEGAAFYRIISLCGTTRMMYPMYPPREGPLEGFPVPGVYTVSIAEKDGSAAVSGVTGVFTGEFAYNFRKELEGIVRQYAAKMRGTPHIDAPDITSEEAMQNPFGWLFYKVRFEITDIQGPELFAEKQQEKQALLTLEQVRKMIQLQPGGAYKPLYAAMG